MDYHEFSKYTNGELSSTYLEYKELRYKLFSPLFLNLYENKVIYRERFTCIVKLEDINITPDHVRATANFHLLIDTGSAYRNKPIPETWTFGAAWQALRFVSNKEKTFNYLAAYANWAIWTDPTFVEQAEKFVLDKNVEAALNLISW